MILNWIKQRAARRETAQRLYQTAVDQSRDPLFYTDMGVADTLDGRFDLVSLHVFLLMERLNLLGPEGRKLAQALFDVMFKTMALTLREMGVGDVGVPKQMQKMMKAFNGRVHAYHEALQSKNIHALQLAVARNIYRIKGESIPRGSEELTAYVLLTHGFFETCSYDDFVKSGVEFPQPDLHETKESAHG